MEMEMRAMEDMEIGEDITFPLSPITSVLHDSFLFTHCSSCFSPLPFSNPNSNSLLFCSPKCSNSSSAAAAFSPDHFPFSHTADLRAASRLLHLLLSNSSFYHPGPPERIFGLLTNREKLILSSRPEFIEVGDELSMRIRKGAEAMAIARRTSSYSVDICNQNVLEEAVLCLVLTNAVEVQDCEGRTLGIAVYDSRFCFINHSCSPNVCYRFLLSSPIKTMAESGESETMMRILPRCSDEGTCQVNSTVNSNLSDLIIKDLQDYGPRIVVRSIKSIRKGEAVTITYSDLLQPKAMRQSELWSKYRFVCCCQRCSVEPLTYIDHALQEISAAKEELSDSTTISNFNQDNAVRRINDYVDDAINEYLSIGSPEASCEKLENVLTFGFCDEQVEDVGGKRLNLRLHPLHHLSLNAYTTLASAYKVHSSDLLALYSNMDERLYDAFAMSRRSAAYSLLLAGATHHLFLSEPSLIVSAANYWVAAGESLLSLGRSSLWTSNSKWNFTVSNLHLAEKIICSKCTWIDKFNASRIHGQALNSDIEEFSVGFFNCFSNISLQTWSFLTSGCHYLKAFKDPFDFSWPKTRTYLNNQDVQAPSTVLVSYRETKDILSSCEPQVYCQQERQSIFQLGIHCLFYGGYLASICYGHHSHLACQIQNILDEMN